MSVSAEPIGMLVVCVRVHEVNQSVLYRSLIMITTVGIIFIITDHYNYVLFIFYLFINKLGISYGLQVYISFISCHIV